MYDLDHLRARQLLALEDFHQKALATHTRVRMASILVLAVMAAASIPGWWWALVLLCSALAFAFELHLKGRLQAAFAVKSTLSAQDVRQLTQRTLRILLLICAAYAAPYLALALAPAPGQAFALLFAIGGLVVIVSQHSITRTMAMWTSLPMVLVVGVNALALAGSAWPLFLLFPVLIVMNIYVLAGAIYASSSQLIDARLQAQDEAQVLDERVRARTAELDLALQSAEAASTAKSRFLATMSHELRTPLNAVIGYAEIIQEDAKAGRFGSLDADAARIRAAGLHLLGVINEILDISRIEAGAFTLKPEPCGLRSLVDGAVEQVRPMALARGNRIEVTYDSVQEAMQTDPGRLRQCLLNLLSNAAKFTAGGRIDVRVGDVDLGGRQGVQFVVSDTGIGIAPEGQAVLFQPFSQVDNTYSRSAEGSGLGLAITRRLARLMGGDVTVVSEAGHGSTFTLTVVADQGALHLAA